MDVERLGCEVLGVEFIGNPAMRVKKLMGAPQPGPKCAVFCAFWGGGALGCAAAVHDVPYLCQPKRILLLNRTSSVDLVRHKVLELVHISLRTAKPDAVSGQEKIA